ARMDTKENPQDFGCSSFCFDFAEMIVLLVFTKTPFHAGCSFFGDERTQLLLLLMIFRLWTFGFKVCLDLLGSRKIPVLVGRINGICSGYTDFGVSQALCLVNAMGEADTFVKGLEADVFDKADPIDLYFIYLSAKLNR